MKSGGYVAIYRSLLEHPLMNQLPAAWFRVFMMILLSSNWRRGVWWNGEKEVEIQPGQLIISVEKLSKLTNVSVKQVRGCLKYLLAANTVAIETTSRYTLITVINWATYQSGEATEGTPTGKPVDEPGAKSRQNRGTVRATIEEGDHHHQGNKQEGKKEVKRARGFPDGQEPAVKPHKCQPLSDPASPDDDEARTATDVAYATPTDELTALFQKRGYRLTLDVCDDIGSKLGGAVTQEYVNELKTHNGNFKSFPGFARSLAGRRSRKVRAPVTAEQAYKCPVPGCGSTVRGEGLICKRGEPVTACSCASPEYVAKMKANGTIGTVVTGSPPPPNGRTEVI